MKRKIIKIDETKCDGCGICADACAEGAIQIIDCKAKLVKDEYCDGLGACIGECPQDAIEIIEREAAEFDEKAVEEHLESSKLKAQSSKDIECQCPSSQPQHWQSDPDSGLSTLDSKLTNWPIQLKLIPVKAEYFNGAALLLTADCVPFADANFHNILKDKKVIIGCPKLDDADFYIEKLSEIIRNNNLKSLTVVHMEVPCCSGLINIAKEALKLSGKKIPLDNIEVKIKS